MKTIVHVELTDQERSDIGYRIGTKRMLTRKDVTALVDGLFDHLKEAHHDQQLHAEVPARPEVAQGVPGVTASEVRGANDCWRAADGSGPRQPNNASYMRGWNAVGEVRRRMKL